MWAMREQLVGWVAWVSVELEGWKETIDTSSVGPRYDPLREGFPFGEKTRRTGLGGLGISLGSEYIRK